MKSINIKTAIVTSAFGLVALFGASEINAQSRNQNDRFPTQVNNQNQKVEMEKQRQEDLRIQNDRDRNDNDRNSWGNSVRYKVYQNGKSFVTDARGLETLKQAIMKGYEEGLKSGKFDSKNRKRGGYNSSNYYGSNIYRNGANYGYQNQIDSRLLQFYFQKGFAEGYQDGFNTRKQRGWNNDNRGWERDNKGLSERELRSILKYERF